MEALLKASEASALMGLSVRHVQRMAKSGELPYQTHMNERNRPEYLFPLSSLCDASAWDADELAVTWGNGVLYDADQEWTERKELVQMGLLKPELALAWKFDLPAESEADLAEIRKNYMPELKDLEG